MDACSSYFITRKERFIFLLLKDKWQCISVGGWSGTRVTEDIWFSSFILQKRFLCTSYNSVHGERPTAEYARQRKQSLEEEFGHVLGTYSSGSISVVYPFGPFLALFRAAVISYHVLKLSIWHLFVHDIHKRATQFCETLIRLGPFYIKIAMDAVNLSIISPH